MKTQAKRMRGLTYQQELDFKRTDAERSREHPNSVRHQITQIDLSRNLREILSQEVAQSRAERALRWAAKKPLVRQARKERKATKMSRGSRWDI